MHNYRAAALFRFCFDEGDFWSCKEADFSRDPLTVYMLKRTVRQYTHSHGIGRHSKKTSKDISRRYERFVNIPRQVQN